MIKGVGFAEQVFKSSDWAITSKSFFLDTDGILKGCSLSNTTSTISIAEGWFITSGYLTQIYATETINITSAGTLIYEIDLSKENSANEFNQGTFKVITGTATKQDLFDEGTLYQYEIATIEYNNGITNIINLMKNANTTLYNMLEEIEKDYEINIKNNYSTFKEEMESDFESIEEDYEEIKENIIVKENVAVVEGTINSSETTASLNIDYPTNFTQTNCIVISVGMKKSDGTSWGYNTTFDTASYMAGGVAQHVRLNETNLTLRAENINIGTDGSVLRSGLTNNFYYKIVLLKIS